MINRISATTNFTGNPRLPLDSGLSKLQKDLMSLVTECETMKYLPATAERVAYIGNLQKQIARLQEQIINKKTSMANQMMMKK